MRQGWLIGLFLLALAGCATSSSSWITFPDGNGGKGVTLEDWLKAHPMSAVREISAEEISRGESGSTQIIQLRTGHPLHVHQRHDLIAILLKGRGVLTLGSRRLELKPGAIVSIPRGVPHAFKNTGSEPAVAYVTYFPAFDDVDTVPVTEPLARSRAKQP